MFAQYIEPTLILPICPYFYTDKYYAGLDDWIYQWEQNSHTYVVRNPAKTMLDYLVASPFRVECTISDAGVLQSICSEHIERYISMVEKSMKNPIEGSLVPAMVNRDANIYDSYLSKLKFEFADVMGRGFAPKAEDIALGILGPKDAE